MTSENLYDKEGFPIRPKRIIRRIIVAKPKQSGIYEVICFELDHDTVAAGMPMQQLMKTLLPGYKYVRPATESEFLLNSKKGKLYEPVRYLQRHCF